MPPPLRQQPAAAPADGPLAVAVGLLRADAPERIMGAPEAWPRWAVLLPHVLATAGLAQQAGPAARR